MFNKFFIAGIIATLVLSYGSVKTYSDHHKKDLLTENTGDPATEDLRIDPKKKYIEEVEPKDYKKQYVDESKIGSEVKYLSDEESPEVFFAEEEKSFGVEKPLNKD